MARTRAVVCFRQLKELRAVLGEDLTAQCIGIQATNLDMARQHPSTWRAVQFLHTLVFRRGTVNLVDILTSFAYSAPVEVVDRDLQRGGGEGI